MEQTNKQAIQEKKIRVVFLPADHATPKTNGVVPRDEHTAQSSPSLEAFTPQRSIDTPVQAKAEPRSADKSQPHAQQPAQSAGPVETVKSTVAAAAAGVASVVPTSRDELQAQLNEAQAQIARLTKQAQEASGLRQRKAEPTHEAKAQLATAQHTQQAPATGVPVQWVAGLCLLSFLIAYFFF